MSLLPSLRQTPFTLAHARPIRPLRSTYISVGTSVRYASSATKLQQEIQQELESQKAMLARAERSNPNLNLSGQKLPIIEPIVDPPTSIPRRIWEWATSKESDQAYQDKRDRRRMTSQSIVQMIGHGALDEYKRGLLRSMPDLLAAIWVNLRGEGVILGTTKQLTNTYYKYLRVQASGTIGQALSISKDDALTTAQNIIRARRDKLTWNLVKENKSPRLVSARITVVDPRVGNMVGQIILAFDTQQALITEKGSAPAVRRTQRVAEMVVFEKLISNHEEWRVKDKLVPKLQLIQEIKKH